MSILFFLQQSDGVLQKGTLIALAAARELKSAWKKDKILGLALGPGASKAGEDALEYGLTEVFVSEDGAYARYLAPTYAAAVSAACEKGGCDTVVMNATSTGKDLAPRVTAALDAGQASDIIAVNGDGSLKRPMYAGDVIADVELLTTTRVVTVRSTAFSPAEKSSKTGSVSILSGVPSVSGKGEVLSYTVSANERPELSDAATIVSGGRALQSSENFEKYIFPLADALGAAVGASRAAVDSGYAPNDWQVGQTGKVVAPTLYVAVGISGAIQHLAGMKDSKTIVAINKDGDAPIFEVADYGLVADLFQAVPELTDAVKKARGK